MNNFNRKEMFYSLPIQSMCAIFSPVRHINTHTMDYTTRLNKIDKELTDLRAMDAKLEKELNSELARMRRNISEARQLLDDCKRTNWKNK